MELGGIIPTSVVTRAAVSALTDFVEMRKTFSKDYEIDEERRKLIVEKIKNKQNKTLNRTENADIERARALFKAFDDQKKNVVKTGSEFVNGMVCAFDNKTIIKLSTTVRTSGKDALAFILNVDSRALLSIYDLAAREIAKADAELDLGGTVKGFEENSENTQIVSMLEDKILEGGEKVENEIVRRMVWSAKDEAEAKDEAGDEDAKQNPFQKFSAIVYNSPTQARIPAKKRRRSRNRSTRGRLFFATRKEVPRVVDKGCSAVKITQLSSSECAVDILFEPIAADNKSGEVVNRKMFRLLERILKVSERSERALRKTSILAMNPAKWLQTATIHY